MSSVQTRAQKKDNARALLVKYNGESIKKKEEEKKMRRQKLAEAKAEAEAKRQQDQDPLQQLLDESQRQQELQEQYQSNKCLEDWYVNSIVTQITNMSETSAKGLQLLVTNQQEQQYETLLDIYRILTEILYRVRSHWEEIRGPDQISDLLLFKDKINKYCKAVELQVNTCKHRVDRNTRNTLNALLNEMKLTIKFMQTYIPRKSVPEIREELLAIDSLIKKVKLSLLILPNV